MFQHAGLPEAGLQVPGGTVEQGETPIEAVAREVLEESGLPLDGWQSVVTPETGVRGWHCFATAPADPLPDSWSWEPAGPEAAEGLRFEYRWVALEAGEALAGAQEKARWAVAAFVTSGDGWRDSTSSRATRSDKERAMPPGTVRAPRPD